MKRFLTFFVAMLWLLFLGSDGLYVPAPHSAPPKTEEEVLPVFQEEEPEMSTDEKVIDLVKKEWGKDDSVTITIEKKNGNKYRVAVRDTSTTVLQWYEVNIDTWKVSEY